MKGSCVYPASVYLLKVNEQLETLKTLEQDVK